MKAFAFILNFLLFALIAVISAAKKAKILDTIDFIRYLVLFSFPLFLVLHLGAEKIGKTIFSSVKQLVLVLNFTLFVLVVGLLMWDGVHLVDLTDFLFYLILISAPFVTMIYLWKK